MSSKIILVLHRQQSCPGNIAAMLTAKGYHVEMRRPALGDTLPDELSEYAGAVVFGGPMSANDEHLPFIRHEIEWIGKVLATGVPYIGICLGAQLLARQLGAHVSTHRRGHVEVGFHAIAPTREGLEVLPRPMHVCQWHREGFTLPAGATLLASGRVFENQMFRYGPNAYGLQFHPEVTPAILTRWLNEPDDGLRRSARQSMLEQHARCFIHAPAQKRWLDGFLDRWLKNAPSVHRAEQGLRDENMGLARA